MRAFLFALALVLAPPPQIVFAAFADDAVLLRTDLRVDGEAITLGDLFDIEGEAASVAIARAPEPGRRTSLDPDYVQAQARQNGLVWSNPNRLRRVTVERASQVIDGDIIVELIAAELAMRDGNEYDIQLTGSSTLHAPTDAFGLPEIASLDFSARTGMFIAELIPYEGAASIRLNGRAHATIDVPVLTRPIAAGEMITANDLDYLPVRADRLRADAVMSFDQFENMEARRALRPGEPVRAYDLRTPVVIERGEIVTLVFTVPGLTLTARARALEDAGADDIARFVNLQSNRTIDAMVEGPGRARVVSSGGPS